jgi:heat shock protein 90kDa beta
VRIVCLFLAISFVDRCPSFLVASDVFVASLPPATKENPNPQQHVFSSSSDATTFEVYPDPRGNTLQTHGTEITLVLKDDSSEYLEESKVKGLV